MRESVPAGPFAIAIIVFMLLPFYNCAQTTNDTSFKPSGKLWGLVFGDYYFKAHSDPLNRGGSNQYTGIEEGRNAFQFRRIYLGYNFDISPKFAAELVAAAEDNVTNRAGVTTGDLTSNNKLSFFIKLANLRWKNIWKGTDLLVGQIATPAFATTTDPVWSYRSVERTITDIRRLSSFDLGLALQGKFDPGTDNYGYNLMVSNGTGARPENDKYKWFQGDIYAKFLDKKIMVDFYSDYQRLNWSSSFHHTRNMIKGFIAYTGRDVTIGTEAFINYSKKDVVGIKGSTNDTLDAKAEGISTFIRGSIIKNKLGYFARADFYNPDTHYDEQSYENYRGLTSSFEPNNKENFITAGLDFTPVKNVHIMPNVWYNRYNSERSNLTPTAEHNYDLVYRATFYYTFGR